MELIFGNVIGIVVALMIVGACKSVIKSGYYLDLPRIEKEDDVKPKRKFYVGKFLTSILLVLAYGYIAYAFGLKAETAFDILKTM